MKTNTKYFVSSLKKLTFSKNISTVLVYQPFFTNLFHCFLENGLFIYLFYGFDKINPFVKNIPQF